MVLPVSEPENKLIIVSDLGTGLIKWCKELGITHHGGFISPFTANCNISISF